MLFLRSNQLGNGDIEAITTSLSANATIKVIDVSSNSEASPDSIVKMGSILETNRTVEYFGMAKLGLENEHVSKMLALVGRFPFPEDQVENQLTELKKRDVIVEKNKKLKASKKPEEPVPALDNIEQITKKNDEGETVQEWVTIKNP